MENIQLYTKINSLPEDLKSEVNDFIDFLLAKRKKEKPMQKSMFGIAKGKIYMSPDFDEPLDDFKDYM
jgi:hypothetical protein